MLDKSFLDILVCPKCHGKLEYAEDSEELRCWACRVSYRIEDDIPIMLIEEARPIPDGETPASS
jgi:uncharacterized protein